MPKAIYVTRADVDNYRDYIAKLTQAKSILFNARVSLVIAGVGSFRSNAEWNFLDKAENKLDKIITRAEKLAAHASRNAPVADYSKLD